MRLDTKEIISEPNIQFIHRLSRELDVKVYLAGGGLRDILLGRRIKDLDFALADMPEEFPRIFAERLGGSFFWLDRERMQSRVVTRMAEGPSIVDFAPLRGEDIEEDLLLRDFTINAMALELADAPRFIDPLNGGADLRKRVIRRCSETSMEDDPLRLLRAVRFAATLGFSIEDVTWDDIGEKGQMLARVAAERIRDEVFQILAAPRVGASLKMLCDSGLMAVLVPGAHREKVVESAVARRILNAVRVEEVANELALHFPEHSRQAAAHLNREIEGGITSLSLLKLAAFIGGVEGADSADAWAARLKLGRRAARMLTLLDGEAGAVIAALSKRPTQRAMFRFFRDHEPAGVELTVLALAREALSPELCSELVRYCFRDYDPAGSELLLSGEEIMGMLGIDAGPAVGAAMERLREAESRGYVNSSGEAREFLVKNMLTKEEPMR